ncbi:hypothetical protein CGCVW01_v012671 [Colletotrichum viniferum]|nr:hypothetical protein CGCVW01_v012671 [Colletotrichum viniferum]
MAQHPQPRVHVVKVSGPLHLPSPSLPHLTPSCPPPLTSSQSQSRPSPNPRPRPSPRSRQIPVYDISPSSSPPSPLPPITSPLHLLQHTNRRPDEQHQAEQNYTLPTCQQVSCSSNTFVIYGISRERAREREREREREERYIREQEISGFGGTSATSTSDLLALSCLPNLLDHPTLFPVSKGFRHVAVPGRPGELFKDASKRLPVGPDVLRPCALVLESSALVLSSQSLGPACFSSFCAPYIPRLKSCRRGCSVHRPFPFPLPGLVVSLSHDPLSLPSPAAAVAVARARVTAAPFTATVTTQ